MSIVAVAGNPKPGSRTLDAAQRVAQALTGAPADDVIDVVTLGPGLLGWGDAAVADAVARLQAAEVAVIASPTYKATYTGLLKCFLDHFAGGEGLRGVVAVPVMLGGGPAHALAPDLLLKPVLAEIGAACPAPGLYLMDSTYAESSAIADYATRWGPVVRAAATAREATLAARPDAR